MKNNSRYSLFMAGLMSTLLGCTQNQETRPLAYKVSVVDCRNFHSANSMVIIEGHIKLIYDSRLDLRKGCLSK